MRKKKNMHKDCVFKIKRKIYKNQDKSKKTSKAQAPTLKHQEENKKSKEIKVAAPIKYLDFQGQTSSSLDNQHQQKASIKEKGFHITENKVVRGNTISIQIGRQIRDFNGWLIFWLNICVF